jgi:hypothetical protein
MEMSLKQKCFFPEQIGLNSSPLKRIRTRMLVKMSSLSRHRSPETSAVLMTIRRFKRAECIYLYKSGQVTERSGYEGRVSLITQELESGNACLRLNDTRESRSWILHCTSVHPWRTAGGGNGGFISP